ncbi:unnamed protein product, partial [Heterosigma akashiwo]
MFSGRADVEATNALGHTPYSNALVLRPLRAPGLPPELDAALGYLEAFIGVDRRAVVAELEAIFPEMRSKRHLILG